MNDARARSIAAIYEVGTKDTVCQVRDRSWNNEDLIIIIIEDSDARIKSP